MTLLFYLMAIYFILSEYSNIAISQQIMEQNILSENYRKVFGKLLPITRWDKDVKSAAIRGIFFMVYSFIGLMSSQMPIFLVIILLGTFKKKSVWSLCFWRGVRIGLLMFILINKYQLHVDFIKLITNFL